MKRFSITWLLKDRALLPWLVRSFLITLLILVAMLLLRSVVEHSADRTRAARVNAKSAKFRSEAMTRAQKQFDENGALFQSAHELIPSLLKAHTILANITTSARNFGWEKAEIENQTITEGSPAGQDISTLHFTLTGDASPAAVSLLLDHLHHADFLLRVNQVNITEEEVKLTGEIYLRAQ